MNLNLRFKLTIKTTTKSEEITRVKTINGSPGSCCMSLVFAEGGSPNSEIATEISPKNEQK